MYTNLDCEVLAVVLMGLLLTGLVWSESDCWFLLEISDVTVEAKDSVSSCLVSESKGKKATSKKYSTTHATFTLNVHTVSISTYPTDTRLVFKSRVGNLQGTGM